MKTAGTSITSSFSLKRSFKRRLRERKLIQSCTIKKKSSCPAFFATIACSKETWEMFSSIGKRLPYTKQIKLWKLHAEILSRSAFYLEHEHYLFHDFLISITTHRYFLPHKTCRGTSKNMQILSCSSV